MSVDVLRLDEIDPRYGGNKLFKLWGHLCSYFNELEVGEHGKIEQPAFSPLASFGGAYSNHLFALAGIGAELGLQTIGFVRGDRPRRLSQTLLDLMTMGMKVFFVDRESYKQKHTIEMRQQLAVQHDLKDVFWIPEGGSGYRGFRGCELLGEKVAEENYSHVLMACGTGTTFAGVYRGIHRQLTNRVSSRSASRAMKMIGVSALRSDRSIISNILASTAYNKKQSAQLAWSLSNQYHLGGFAKLPSQLSSFMRGFEEETAIPTDRVYTGKMFYALSHMLEKEVFSAGDRVLVIHSGGLQGNRSLADA